MISSGETLVFLTFLEKRNTQPLQMWGGELKGEKKEKLTEALKERKIILPSRSVSFLKDLTVLQRKKETEEVLMQAAL